MFQSNCWKAKNKGRNLKTAREKQPITRKLSSVTLISDFWSETRKARRKGGNVLAGLKEELSTKNSISNKAIFQMKEG